MFLAEQAVLTTIGGPLPHKLPCSSIHQVKCKSSADVGGPSA
jgi:hypothetical protein